MNFKKFLIEHKALKKFVENTQFTTIEKYLSYLKRSYKKIEYFIQEGFNKWMEQMTV